MTQLETAAVRFLPARAIPVVKATDLGSVQVLKHGNRYLLTDSFGDIHPDSRGLGLYHGDTRVLACSVLRVGGSRPVLLQTSVGANYRGGIQLTNPSADRNPDAKVHPTEGLIGRTIGISRERLMGADGVSERVKVVNHAANPAAVPVELELGADGADIFEVRGYPRETRGRLLPVAATDRRVTFRYVGLDGVERLTHIAFSEPAEAVEPIDHALPDGSNTGAAVRLRWTLRMGPGETRVLSWTIWGTDRTAATDPTDEPTGAADQAALFPSVPRVSPDEGAAAYHAWERGTASVDSDHELFNLVIKRSVSDLRLLVNDGPGEDQRYVSAGVPWFTTLFGRDSLISAFQALAFRPQIAVEILDVLAASQATTDDPFRDAEPGKILHELRTGEMARSGELPHTPYYGSVDSTPLWLILFGATFDWTGDRGMVERLWPNALAALAWIDTYGDRDGDGFVEYERRSERGLLNQGWKDSSDAIRDRTGREAEAPIALAEVQGYVFDAKRRMARLAAMRGDVALATRLDADADTLATRFEEAFWIDGSPLLRHGARPRQAPVRRDRQQRRALPVVGHRVAGARRRCRGAAAAPGDVLRLGHPDVRRRPARLQPDRLPHRHGLAARRVDHRRGLQALRLRRRVRPGRRPHDGGGAGVPGLSPAGALLRLRPERRPHPGALPRGLLPAGVGRRVVLPVPETMLGLRAHAERKELELLHPHLPDWLGKVTLTDLRVGDASVDLLFHRWRGTTSAEVLRKVGDVAVTIRL